MVWKGGKMQDYQWSMNKLQKAGCFIGVWGICVLQSGLFVWASLHKFLNPEAFAELISKNVELYPWLAGSAAIWLPCFELSLSLALLVPKAQKAALIISTILLAFFSVIIVSHLVRGLAVPCRCFSNQDEPASWWNVARNLTLISFAVGALFLKNIQA